MSNFQRALYTDNTDNITLTISNIPNDATGVSYKFSQTDTSYTEVTTFSSGTTTLNIIISPGKFKILKGDVTIIVKITQPNLIGPTIFKEIVFSKYDGIYDSISFNVVKNDRLTFDARDTPTTDSNLTCSAYEVYFFTDPSTVTSSTSPTVVSPNNNSHNVPLPNNFISNSLVYYVVCAKLSLGDGNAGIVMRYYDVKFGLIKGNDVMLTISKTYNFAIADRVDISTDSVDVSIDFSSNNNISNVRISPFQGSTDIITGLAMTLNSSDIYTATIPLSLLTDKETDLEFRIDYDLYSYGYSDTGIICKSNALTPNPLSLSRASTTGSRYAFNLTGLTNATKKTYKVYHHDTAITSTSSNDSLFVIPAGQGQLSIPFEVLFYDTSDKVVHILTKDVDNYRSVYDVTFISETITSTHIVYDDNGTATGTSTLALNGKVKFELTTDVNLLSVSLLFWDSNGNIHADNVDMSAVNGGTATYQSNQYDISSLSVAYTYKITYVKTDYVAGSITNTIHTPSAVAQPTSSHPGKDGDYVNKFPDLGPGTGHDKIDTNGFILVTEDKMLHPIEIEGQINNLIVTGATDQTVSRILPKLTVNGGSVHGDMYVYSGTEKRSLICGALEFANNALINSSTRLSVANLSYATTSFTSGGRIKIHNSTVNAEMYVKAVNIDVKDSHLNLFHNELYGPVNLDGTGKQIAMINSTCNDARFSAGRSAAANYSLTISGCTLKVLNVSGIQDDVETAASGTISNTTVDTYMPDVDSTIDVTFNGPCKIGTLHMNRDFKNMIAFAGTNQIQTVTDQRSGTYLDAPFTVKNNPKLTIGAMTILDWDMYPFNNDGSSFTLTESIMIKRLGVQVDLSVPKTDNGSLPFTNTVVDSMKVKYHGLGNAYGSDLTLVNSTVKNVMFTGGDSTNANGHDLDFKLSNSSITAEFSSTSAPLKVNLKKADSAKPLASVINVKGTPLVLAETNALDSNTSLKLSPGSDINVTNSKVAGATLREIIIAHPEPSHVTGNNVAVSGPVKVTNRKSDSSSVNVNNTSLAYLSSVQVA